MALKRKELLALLRNLFGDQFTISEENDSFVITAPRKLNKDEIDSVTESE